MTTGETTSFRGTPLHEMPEDLRVFNRERYKSEIAQGIFDLMQRQGVSYADMAKLLGVTPARVSHVMSGEENLGAETVADWLLVLGRAAHLALSEELDSVRFPTDEAVGIAGLDSGAIVQAVMWEDPEELKDGKEAPSYQKVFIAYASEPNTTGYRSEEAHGILRSSETLYWSRGHASHLGVVPGNSERGRYKVRNIPRRHTSTDR